MLPTQVRLTPFRTLPEVIFLAIPLFDAGCHLLEFAVRALHGPSFWAMSFLSSPDPALRVARMIFVNQFSLNAIPAT